MPRTLMTFWTDSAGRVHLKNENWVAGGTASIMRGRHVLLQSGDTPHAGQNPTQPPSNESMPKIAHELCIAPYTHPPCMS